MELTHSEYCNMLWTIDARNTLVDSSWNVMAHGDAREGKWKGNWQMEWVASTLHSTLEHGVSSITTADAHTLAAGSRLNWSLHWFKWTCLFCQKMKSGFCACAITFQMQSTTICAMYGCSFVSCCDMNVLQMSPFYTTVCEYMKCVWLWGCVTHNTHPSASVFGLVLMRPLLWGQQVECRVTF